MQVKNNMEKRFRNTEAVKLDRRKLLQAMGWTASAVVVANAFPDSLSALAGDAAQDVVSGTRVFPVKTVNHLSLAVADYAKSRDFYVDLLGMRVVWDNGKGVALEFGDLKAPNGIYIRNVSNPGEKATVNHIAYALPDFMKYKAAMKAELERHHLTNMKPDGDVGWICDDPAGYMLNIVATKDHAMYPGAAATCDVASSPQCKAGWEEGLKNLSTATKPGGKGFKATSYSHVVLHVPEKDIAKETEFYRDVLAMKVLYTKSGDNPQSILRFGQNTLNLRKTPNPGDKPYCTHFAFVVENFNRDKVKAELELRSLSPKPYSDMAWSFMDPDGFQVELAAWGLPEHLAKDCRGDAASCPSGTGN